MSELIISIITTQNLFDAEVRSNLTMRMRSNKKNQPEGTDRIKVLIGVEKHLKCSFLFPLSSASKGELASQRCLSWKNYTLSEISNDNALGRGGDGGYLRRRWLSESEGVELRNRCERGNQYLRNVIGGQRPRFS